MHASPCRKSHPILSENSYLLELIAITTARVEGNENIVIFIVRNLLKLLFPVKYFGHFCALRGVLFISSVSPTLAQDRLAESDQSGKNPLKYSAIAGN